MNCCQCKQSASRESFSWLRTEWLCILLTMNISLRTYADIISQEKMSPFEVFPIGTLLLFFLKMGSGWYLNFSGPLFKFSIMTASLSKEGVVLRWYGIREILFSNKHFTAWATDWFFFSRSWVKKNLRRMNFSSGNIWTSPNFLALSSFCQEVGGQFIDFSWADMPGSRRKPGKKDCVLLWDMGHAQFHIHQKNMFFNMGTRHRELQAAGTSLWYILEL